MTRTRSVSSLMRVKTCGVSWGYATESFERTPPDAVIDHFEQLEPLVRKR